ncbi:MAG: SUMF1/EgtB/PvdO family nonheme iron enzyme [Bacteroidia bacterium]|nr:SUMF1/EgtB/PvdO family nonheme iron enzyme [Bacteroidia bacterium]
MSTKLKISFMIALMLIISISCKEKVSNTTGWAYNDSENGGFDVPDYVEQETGPGLVLIEGGTFTMGRTEQDVIYDWNNVPRRVTVSSFYIDQTEVKNVDYREYLYWLTRVFTDYPEVYKKALPDTLVWREKLAYNEPMVELYLRHPAYMNYPVVGVNWLQCNDYCAWRTDRVNEWILVEKTGLLMWDPNQNGDNNFNTDAYLAGKYDGLVNPRNQGMLEDLDPNKDKRKVRMEDGVFLPRYRLPTEAEWEFAALALIGEMKAQERIFERRLYPWGGHYIRNDESSSQGLFMANSMRGRGDNMGVAGALNDRADITAPVDAYWPNDYGLYCMAGNVNEWVMDVYRPMSSEDANEFRPFRGNVYTTQMRDSTTGEILDKDSLGRIQWRKVTDEESYDRRNYNSSDNINYLDGDWESSVVGGGSAGADWNTASNPKEKTAGSSNMYFYGENYDPIKGTWDKSKEPTYRIRGKEMRSMINDNARIYKGGSWKDRAYWMTPGSRRYLDQRQRTADLGFRCAMVRVGSPVGNK